MILPLLIALLLLSPAMSIGVNGTLTLILTGTSAYTSLIQTLSIDISILQNNATVISASGQAEIITTATDGSYTTTTIIQDGDLIDFMVGTSLATNITGNLIGNFAGNFIGNLIGNIMGDVSGNATSATSALTAVASTTATYFTQPLIGDVNGTQLATVVNSVGGQSSANVASATIAANNATNNNTANTIVKRDSSGNFSAGTITASLTGAASLNVLKAGDTMTGSLTLPAGTVFSPALQFTGSTKTGISAATANILSFDTNAAERMRIDAAGNIVMTSTLTVPAATAASPSIQFAGSTNTGFSAATANTLSFDTNGVERMNVSTTAITAGVALLRTNILCDQAIQAITPTTNGSATINNTTSILLLQHTSNITNFTITFPSNPTTGQLVTIALGTTNTITLNYTAGSGGASFVNTITTLDPTVTAGLLGVNGTAVITYLYYASSNTWYRYRRG